MSSSTANAPAYHEGHPAGNDTHPNHAGTMQFWKAAGDSLDAEFLGESVSAFRFSNGFLEREKTQKWRLASRCTPNVESVTFGSVTHLDRHRLVLRPSSFVVFTCCMGTKTCGPVSNSKLFCIFVQFLALNRFSRFVTHRES